MGNTKMEIYNRMPRPARSIAATLRGVYLWWWRYGPHAEQLVEQALEREKWSLHRWKTWQEGRLAYVLHRAATQVPYYHEQWAARRARGDRASWEILDNWPILSKDPLREKPHRFVAEDCDIRRMFHAQTSGTTGTPLDLWRSRETLRAWYALFEARCRRWHGVSRHDNWAILGGQLVTPVAQQQPPFWVWNAAMNQLYLSSNHVRRENIPAYIDALSRYSIAHLVSYTSSACALAREALDLGIRATGLKVVITNAEPVFPWQRDTIAQGFRCDVRETYGMGEIVAAASECRDGRLHLWPEVGWLEILGDTEDMAVPRGTSGRLVWTGLLNADMPLIRYDVGDRGSLVAEDGDCSCGRTLPVFSHIEGRTNDLLITPDGRRVYWVNPVFYGLPVREAQIIQEQLESLRVRYVPAPTYSPKTDASIIERLHARMGPVAVNLEKVNEIPRGPNGKFRAVISHVADTDANRDNGRNG